MKKIVLRALIVVSIVAAVGAAAVLAGTHFLLGRGRLLRIIVKNPESFYIDYAGARSPWPGRLRFTNLVLRVRDSNVELLARLEDVDVDVSLADLAARRFHATRVSARRLSFRLRERVEPSDAASARFYPPIEGFTDPPLKPPGPEPLSSPARWRAAVDSLSVEEVAEIWIDGWRFTGTARLHGGFELAPGRRAFVAPSLLSAIAGDLRRGGEPAVDAVSGALWSELPPFDPDDYPGNEVWKIVNGGASLKGRLQDLSTALAVAPSTVRGGAGPVRFAVVLRDGVGRGRFAGDLTTVSARSGRRQLVFRGARLEVRAPSLDFPRERVSFAGTRVELSGVSVDGSEPSAPRAAVLRAEKADLVLRRPMLVSRVFARLADARPLRSFLPKGTRLAADLAHPDGLEAVADLRAGRGKFELTSVSARAGNLSVRGDYRNFKNAPRGAFLVEKGLLKVGVSIEADGSRVHPFAGRGWFEREALPGGLRAAR